MRIPSSALALAAACLAAAPVAARVYFTDNFRNYGYRVRGVNPDIPTYVGNDPIWKFTANLDINTKDGQKALVYEKGIGLPPGGKFDFLAKTAFLNSRAADAEKGLAAIPAAFDIVFADVRGKEQAIRVTDQSIGGVETGFVAKNHKLFGFALVVKGGVADLYAEKARAFTKIGSLALSVQPATVNLRTVPGCRFRLAEITVRDPAPLPSHPAAAQFADFASLSQPIAGAKVSAKDETLSLDPGGYAGLRFAVGPATNRPHALQIAFAVCEGAPPKPITVSVPKFHHFTAPGDNPGAHELAKSGYPDAFVDFGRNAGGYWFVRPNLAQYASSYDIEPQAFDVLRDFARLPAASRHPFDLEFVREKPTPGGTAADSIRVFIDGSLAGTVVAPSNAIFTAISATFQQGVSYAVKENPAKGVDLGRYTPIDLSANPRAKTFAKSKSSVKPGLQTIQGAPMIVAAPIDSADVGICRQAKGNWALEVDQYFGRTPQDGLPSAIHYRIPAAPYARAHLLVAMDPDPKKDRVLNVRLAQYWHNGSGQNLVGDALLDLSDGEVPDTFKQVGTVSLKGRDVPLYYTVVDLPTERILDLLQPGGTLDFEFVGKLWANFQQLHREYKPDPSSTSAFSVFGVTLEKTPVSMDIRPGAPANVYNVDEKGRKTTAILTATRNGAKATLAWTAKDADGREVFSGKRDVSFGKAGEKKEVDISLDKPGVGHYTLDIELRAGDATLRQAAAFGILPPKKRLVSRWDSPYTTWWFNSHGSPGKGYKDKWGNLGNDIGGSVIQKAGIRRYGWNSLSREEQDRYDATVHGGFGFNVRGFDRQKGVYKERDIDVPDPSDPTGKKKVKKHLSGEEAFVHDACKAMDLQDPKEYKYAHPYTHMMIWHESAPASLDGIPGELLGLPAPKVDERAKMDARMIDEASRLIRKYFPGLKLQLGNSSASIGAVANPMRAGAKGASFDLIGNETPSQTIPTERLIECGLQGLQVAEDIGRYYDPKHKWQTSGTWEFTYRTDLDLGQRRQAEWYMRDVLLSLSKGFVMISPAILFDCRTAYYNCLWGCSGMFQRAPYLYPKQSYVAYAVLTYALDGVKFVRQIPTGSTTVYAIEFKRLDGKTATALWAARGEVDFAVESASAGTAIAMLGAETPVRQGANVLHGGTSPMYVVTDKPLKSVSIAKRGFAHEEEIAAHSTIAPCFTNVAAVAEVRPDMEMDWHGVHNFLPVLKASEHFTVAQVEDEERGPCVEVTLDTSKEKGYRYFTEFSTVRLKEPVVLPADANIIGAWVKGNSNWGQIRFEIEDAKGEVWKNLSTGPSWACDIQDWPGNLAVSFDGWCYVYTTLARESKHVTRSPGPALDQWVSEGGDKVMDFPVKVRAVTVGMNREKLNFVGFEPAVPSVRLWGVGGAPEF